MLKSITFDVKRYSLQLQLGDSSRIRTGVARMRTWRPGPLDDGALWLILSFFRLIWPLCAIDFLSCLAIILAAPNLMARSCKRVNFFPMIMTNRNMLTTQAGLNQLREELGHLTADRRPKLIERLSLARSMGDLSENSDYQSAKEELAFTDGRIAELEEIIKNAKISVPATNDSINFGHSVTIQIGQSQAIFRIVGEWEADPAQKKISHTSPLGQALMGKKIGDQVQVDAPAGKVVYTIVAIG